MSDVAPPVQHPIQLIGGLRLSVGHQFQHVDAVFREDMVHDVLKRKGYVGIGGIFVGVFFDFACQILFAVRGGISAPYLTIGTILERDDHNLGAGI